MEGFEVLDDGRTMTNVANQIKESVTVPAGYMRVVLPSEGKLAPAFIHIRNFTMEELIDITSASEDFQMETLLRSLSQMIWEKVDVTELHEKDVEFILASVRATWWDSSLRNVPYFKDESNENLEDNVGRVTLSIKDLQVLSLPEKFKEPLVITNAQGDSVGFRLSRITYAVKARDLAREGLGKKKLEQFDELTLKRQKDEAKVSDRDNLVFDRLSREFQALFQKFYQSQLLVSHNGKELKTIEAQREAFEKVGADFWIRFLDFVQKHCFFGFDPKVTFPDPDDPEKLITRRLSFQLLDFVPSLEIPDDSGYTISFGA